MAYSSLVSTVVASLPSFAALMVVSIPMVGKQVRAVMSRHVTAVLLSLVVGISSRGMADDSAAFRAARPGMVFSFPRDHGRHTDYRTEWWYFTGHLFADGASAEAQRDLFADTAAFGFQLTFFRRGDEPVESEWAQGYMAHAAITDLRRQSFVFDRRLSRGGIGIAGSSTSGLDVWHGNWSAKSFGESLVLTYSLRTKEGRTYDVRLVATPAFDPVLQGEAGYSKKGECSECASFYYSMPRLALRGEVLYGTERVKVHGLGWMDHEFMSNALAPDQVGWDWFSLMLKDGRSVMLFRLRNREGGSSFSSGTVINRDGRVLPLKAEDFQIESTSVHLSTKTAARYPNSWLITIPREQLRLELGALLADQEILGEEQSAPSYWEGAVRSKDGEAIGYVELTGYDKPIGSL